jgi:hypothetical protein
VSAGTVVEKRRIAGARQAQGRAVPEIDDGYAVFFEDEYRSVLRTAFLIVRDQQRAEDASPRQVSLDPDQRSVRRPGIARIRRRCLD